MRIVSFSAFRQRAAKVAGGLALTLALGHPEARAEVPEWLRAAARMDLPAYSGETNAVILLDEQQTRVIDRGDIRTTRRLAYKILRPGGREHASFVVAFDAETKVTFLKAWSIKDGREEEVKEKDAIETGLTADTLYSDVRRKIITAPSSEPGAVVGYEYEQKRRPTVLQDVWWVQDPLPVRRGRFVLQLPQGWKHRAVWIHHKGVEPRAAAENEWTWEVENVPAIETEASMPPWKALGGRLAVSYFAEEATREAPGWADIGRWYASLVQAVRGSTPEIGQKVQELASAAASTRDKVRALTEFVQQDIRYVAIEIGIGGYQPHRAGDVLRNRYGDCKDKVALLSTMLKELGVESYFVLVHSQRGSVASDSPSASSFDHVILAVRLSEDFGSGPLFSAQRHGRLGHLLFFDPTDPVTPLGHLPPALQGSFGLLVSENGGELVQLPVVPPAGNRLIRVARMTLDLEGTLAGIIQEIRWGDPAGKLRKTILAANAVERQRFLDDRFGLVGGVTIKSAQIENVEDLGQSLLFRCEIKAESYARRAGDLILIRPRIIGWKGAILGEDSKARKLPFLFDALSNESDSFEISLPEGYTLEELPEPVESIHDFGEYRSRTTVEGKVLRYTRSYSIKSLQVSPDRFADLRRFCEAIAADQGAFAVLKRADR